MSGVLLNSFLLNTERLNNGTFLTDSFNFEIGRKQDSLPVIKLELWNKAGTQFWVLDSYYLEGGKFSQTKDRTAAEIQAGDFDVVLSNQDDYFSEYVPGSVLRNFQYHGARLRVYVGMREKAIIPITGKIYWTIDYQQIGEGYIDQLIADPVQSRITFRCRDILKFIIDRILNLTPTTELPTYGGGNFGNGLISAVNVRPFKTKNETWTLTCTLQGGDGVATFSVVGSVSGNVGTATSGTQFTTGSGAGGIKFTINAGTNIWHVADTITFATKQYPEWTNVNVVKIIWSILTGYDWDTDTQQAWSGQVFSFSHTKSTANTDLDYTAFAAAITLIDGFGPFNLTGYIERDATAQSVFQELLLLVLGSFFSNEVGQLSIKVYNPAATLTPAAFFRDTQKITQFGYNRNIEEVINYAVVFYKKTLTWDFSDITFAFDGVNISSDSTSISKYGTLAQSTPFQIHWYATNGYHARDMCDKIIARYAEPPLNMDIVTGSDALLINSGDIVSLDDPKYGFLEQLGEVVQITKNIDEKPIHVAMRVRADAELAYKWAVIGSQADEGDGASPQTDDYDSASTADKNFAYFSQVGSTTPDYRMF